MPESKQDAWIKFDDFEKWAKGNNWLLFCQEYWKTDSFYYYITPYGTSVCAAKDKQGEFAGFKDL